MSSSPARDARAILDAHVREARLFIARAEVDAAKAARTAPGIAPIDPAELHRMFRSDIPAAWRALAGLTDAQLINQAIEYATDVLEPMGVRAQWVDVLAVWRRKLAAKRAA